MKEMNHRERTKCLEPIKTQIKHVITVKRGKIYVAQITYSLFWKTL